MNYTLYNKQIDRRLTHPVIGLWYTSDLKEAEEMLEACCEHLDASNLSKMKDSFVIIDVETGEEISI